MVTYHLYLYFEIFHATSNLCKAYLCKLIIRPEVLSQQIHCSNEAISFPNETSPEEFVSRTAHAIALWIPTVLQFTRNMHAHIREQMISCSFFSDRKKKLLSPRQRIWWHAIYISCLPSSKKLEKNIFHTENNLSKIKHIH